MLINADLFASGVATSDPDDRIRAGRHQAADHHGRDGGAQATEQAAIDPRRAERPAISEESRPLAFRRADDRPEV